jgi:hypothetical protein
MLPVMSHEVEPDRLPRIVGERAHLGLVIVSGEPHVIRAATLLAENGVPRLLLVTSATVRLVSEKGLGDARTTMTSPRDSDEARDCCERFLLRASDDSDAHRRRCPALLAEGGTATRQRALRTWEQLPIAARDLVAACNGLTSHEVSQLLEGDGPATVEQTIVLAQLDADLRESLADFKQTRLSSEVLASAQIDAFRKYCGRSRLPLGGDVARALFKKGEDRERRRQGRHAVGAETRQPLGHWTHWGDLREE